MAYGHDRIETNRNKQARLLFDYRPQILPLLENLEVLIV